MKELQKYLDEKYPELILLVGQKDTATYASGLIHYYFYMDRVREPVGMADQRLLHSLLDGKDLIEGLIEKVRINLEKSKGEQKQCQKD